MRVLTFSRHFPAGHPKAGQPTYFTEKVMACLADRIHGWTMYDSFVQYDWYAYYNCSMPKHHTIRCGSRWKTGDMASLRVWSDKPYRSKQIEFAQVEVKRVWEIEISEFWFINGGILEYDQVVELAKNDGLEYTDFVNWFNIHPKQKDHVFKGQILTWSDKINYTSLTRKSITMKIENQVCTLEQAKRLKELGVRQDSQYYWRCGKIEHVSGVNSWGDQETLGEMIKRNDSIWSPNWRDDYEIYSAFTVAELAAMIGKGTNAASLLYDAVQARMNQSHSFTICYSPQFLANCVIGLLETKRLTPAEVNERLKDKQ